MLNTEDICFKFVDGELKKVYHVSDKRYSAKLMAIKDYIDEYIDKVLK